MEEDKGEEARTPKKRRERERESATEKKKNRGKTFKQHPQKKTHHFTLQICRFAMQHATFKMYSCATVTVRYDNTNIVLT